MKSAPLIFLLAIFLACGPAVTVQTVPQRQPQSSPETAQGTVKGILRQVGNSPHMEVVVSGESAAFGKGDYFLVGPRAGEFALLPLGPITVKGKLRRMVMRLAGTSGKTRTRLDVDVSEYTR